MRRTPLMLLRNMADLARSVGPLRLPLLLLTLLIMSGTLGYWLLMDVSVSDAFYQAIITLSTVGFDEVRPFDDATKMFTNILIISGVGTVFYTLTLLVATVVEGDLRRRYERRLMDRRIRSLKDHYIVCGYGRVGIEVVNGFIDRKTDFVIVDQDQEVVDRAIAQNHLVVLGSVTEEEVLRHAGVERARALITTTNSDAVNTYVALTAKHLNPEIYVVARSEVPGSEAKLRLAGADRVISPHRLSGRQMMLSAIQPMMSDFMETLTSGRHGDLIIADLEVRKGSTLDGCALSKAFVHAPTTRVLSIRRKNGHFVVGPTGDHVLEAGDVVIVLAEEAQLANFHEPAAS